MCTLWRAKKRQSDRNFITSAALSFFYFEIKMRDEKICFFDCNIFDAYLHFFERYSDGHLQTRKNDQFLSLLQGVQWTVEI